MDYREIFFFFDAIEKVFSAVFVVTALLAFFVTVILMTKK